MTWEVSFVFYSALLNAGYAISTSARFVRKQDFGGVLARFVAMKGEVDRMMVALNVAWIDRNQETPQWVEISLGSVCLGDCPTKTVRMGERHKR